MAASGTILLSAMPPAAFVYMSGILLPSALKCLALNQKGYLLLGALALSCWGFLAVLITKITRDISERKMAEMALAKRDAQLALAEKSARVGSYSFDFGSGMVQNSPGYATIHGLAEGTEEFPRDEWRTRVHPDDLRRLDALRDQAFDEQRREHNTEYRSAGPDGKVQWIELRALVSYDGDGRATRLVGVNIDVTERKRAEAILKESEIVLADALAAGQVIAFEWDARTGQSRRSDNANHVVGDEQGGTANSRRNDFLRRVHPDDQERFRSQIRKLCPENPPYALSFRFCGPNGHQLWLEETARGEFDATGRLLRIKGLTRDTTERKKAEMALAERNMQLSLAGKAALVGSFAFDAGSERVKNLSGLRGHSRLPRWDRRDCTQRMAGQRAS